MTRSDLLFRKHTLAQISGWNRKWLPWRQADPLGSDKDPGGEKMRIVVGGTSRFKGILEVERMVRRHSLSINARRKEKSRGTEWFLAWIST